MTDQGSLLIADDEPTFLRSTAELFRQQGYECATAEDAEQALEKLAAGSYDVVMADIKMSGNADLRLVEELHQRYRDIPVILITGYPSVKTAVQSVNLEVAAYLTKPLDFDELHQAVQRAVRARQARRTVLDNAQRLSQWASDLLTMRDAEGQGKVDIEAFFALTTRNILQSLVDLRNLTRAVQSADQPGDACHLLACPRPLELTRALNHAVAVLHKTKNSFKSKELGALRRQLEATIAEYGVQLGEYQERQQDDAPRFEARK